jgi:hypothetical protein
MHVDSSRRLTKCRGAALLEFALISLALYFILAATIDLGRAMFAAQVLQDAARLAAREFALVSLAADITFDGALQNPTVKDQIFNEFALAIDITGKSDADLKDCISRLPVVNKALVPLMFADKISDTQTLLRYPGALITGNDPTNPLPPPYATCPASGMTVRIPTVSSRNADGVETITWADVLQETTSDSFPLNPPNGGIGGMANLTMNYPFQAALLSSFRNNPDNVAGEPPKENLDFINNADDEHVDADDQPGLVSRDSTLGTYTGTYGLGNQAAFGGKTVRPFRRLLSSQAIFRREVFQ